MDGQTLDGVARLDTPFIPDGGGGSCGGDGCSGYNK